MKSITCCMCGKQAEWDNGLYRCKCGAKFDNTRKIIVQKSAPTNQYVPKCPTCGSPDVEKISLSSKVVGGALFGLFSSNVRKTMHCKNCGYKW